MSDDTNKATAANDALDQAAADAVASQVDDGTQTDDGIQTDDQTIIDDQTTTDDGIQADDFDADGLPIDHDKRSDLGRKVAAFHRRQDETDKRIDRMLSILETRTKPDEPKIELDPDETVTFAEMQRFISQEKEKETQQKTDYDQKYVASISEQASGLEENEYNAILDEMQNVTYTPSTNPSRDAERNFDKAEKIYLRKQLAGKKGEKVNPVKGDPPKSALGGIVNQKVVVKDATLPKLDAPGQSYLAFVAKEDGNEKATELHRSLGKED